MNEYERTFSQAAGQVRDLLRTKTQYLHWIRRFIVFHSKNHPREMSAPRVEAFLTHLAVKDRVAPASIQNQTLSALLFLYRQVLKSDLPRSRMIFTWARLRGLFAARTGKSVLRQTNMTY